MQHLRGWYCPVLFMSLTQLDELKDNVRDTATMITKFITFKLYLPVRMAL